MSAKEESERNLKVVDISSVANRDNGVAAIAKAMAVANRRNPEAVTWRDEVEEKVWLTAWDAELSTEQFFRLISRKIGKYFASLSDISERDLGTVFDIIMKFRAARRRRPS